MHTHFKEGKRNCMKIVILYTNNRMNTSLVGLLHLQEGLTLVTIRVSKCTDDI